MNSDGDHNLNDKNTTPLESVESAANGSLPAESEVQAELQRLREEIAQWQDKYLRKLAEFDNFRKRTRQEYEMLRQIVAESLMVGLLPVVDDFDRMLAGAPSADDPLRKGLELIYGKLRAFLEAQNVTKFDAVGAVFDPEQHDALLLQPAPDFPAGTVLNVITPGYRMGERVIRHAQVVVSAEPVAETDEEDGANATHSP